MRERRPGEACCWALPRLSSEFALRPARVCGVAQHPPHRSLEISCLKVFYSPKENSLSLSLRDADRCHS